MCDHTRNIPSFTGLVSPIAWTDTHANNDPARAFAVLTKKTTLPYGYGMLGVIPGGSTCSVHANLSSGLSIAELKLESVSCCMRSSSCIGGQCTAGDGSTIL